MSNPFRCEDCPQRFAGYLELENHRRNAHTEHFSCPMCRTTWTELRNLRTHMKREHFPSLDEEEFKKLFAKQRKKIESVRLPKPKHGRAQFQASQNRTFDNNATYSYQPSVQPQPTSFQHQMPGMPVPLGFEYPGMSNASYQNFDMTQPYGFHYDNIAPEPSRHTYPGRRMIDEELGVWPNYNIDTSNFDLPPNGHYDNRPPEPSRYSEVNYLPAYNSQQQNSWPNTPGTSSALQQQNLQFNAPGTSSGFPATVPGTFSGQQQEDQESFPLHHGNYFGPNQ